jgi:hypothetical protein
VDCKRYINFDTNFKLKATTFGTCKCGEPKAKHTAAVLTLATPPEAGMASGPPGAEHVTPTVTVTVLIVQLICAAQPPGPLSGTLSIISKAVTVGRQLPYVNATKESAHVRTKPGPG